MTEQMKEDAKNDVKRMTIHAVTLDKESLDILRKLGNGVLSQGIRNAARQVRDSVGKYIQQDNYVGA